MFSTSALFSAALLACAVAFEGARAEFAVNATALVQCGSAHVTWDTTTGPYNLIVVPASAPCSEVLVDLGDHNGPSMTWYNITLAVGTAVQLSLEDADGDEAWTGNMTVVAGNSTACLPGATPSATPSSPSAAPTKTALVVNPEVAPTPAVASPKPAAPAGSASAGGAAQAAGAINAGSNPTSGAYKLSAPALALSALAVLVSVIASVSL